MPEISWNQEIWDRKKELQRCYYETVSLDKKNNWSAVLWTKRKLVSSLTPQFLQCMYLYLLSIYLSIFYLSIYHLVYLSIYLIYLYIYISTYMFIPPTIWIPSFWRLTFYGFHWLISQSKHTILNSCQENDHRNKKKMYSIWCHWLWEDYSV